jgi:heme-degrading monooxygenase HmoA
MSGIAKGFAQLPKPSYYAVIFSSLRTPGGSDDKKTWGYGKMADRMVELAKEQPGYLGVESARGIDGFGITVSYWQDEAAIRNWKAHAEHLMAQETGIRHWYEHYELRVAKVERAYGKQPQREDVQTNDDVAVVWGGQ